MKPGSKKCAGYSLIELISIIAVIGVLAAFITPRFVDQTGFASRGFYDQAQALVGYAQKIAIAQRRTPPTNQPIVVTISANSISVCCNKPDGSGGPVLDPNTGAALVLNTPNGITLTPATTFSFDGSGAPSAGVTITVNSTGAGDTNRRFSVEPVTGYVHCVIGDLTCR